MRRAVRLKQKNSQTRTANLQRQKGVLLGIKQRILFISKLLLVLLVIIGAVFLWKSDVINYASGVLERSINRTFSAVGLIVNDVMVEGRANTKTDDIMKIVNAHHGTPIYMVSPEDIKTGLEKLPWVRSATVQRRLSGVVYIRLVEKQPIALWQESSKLYLIDEKGDVIEKVDPKTAKNLIIIIGSQAPTEARNLLDQLSQVPQLREKVKAATFISGRRWDLILKNKVKIQLPENDIGGALVNLSKLDKQHLITDGRVLSIDLRMPDRSFLYLSPQEHMRMKNGGAGEEV